MWCCIELELGIRVGCEVGGVEVYCPAFHKMVLSFDKSYLNALKSPPLAITGQYGGKLRSEISPWCVVVLNWYWNWVLDLVVKLVVWWCMTCISQEWYQNLTNVQQAMCQSNT